MSGRDHVPLSARERQTLAHLEAQLRLDDPGFAGRMGGRSWRWISRVVRDAQMPRLPAWLGPVLLVFGLVATLFVVGSMPWLSILTLGVAVVGAQRVGYSMKTKIDSVRQQQMGTRPD